MPAISSGCATRPSGMACSAFAAAAGGVRPVSGVSTQPGAMLLAVMPCAAHCSASARVMPINPAFDAA